MSLGAPPSLAHDHRGATAMEFGFAASALMVMMVGAIELSVLMWQIVTLQSVASEAARCAAIAATGCTTATNTKTYAVNLATSWLGSGVISTSNVTVAAVTSCGQASASGNFEKVSISPPAWTSALLYPFVRQTVTLTACYPT